MSERLAFKSAGAVRKPREIRPSPSGPTVEQIAKIIGRTPNDLCDDPCEGKCETDGGTCICVELYGLAAQRIIDLFDGLR